MNNITTETTIAELMTTPLEKPFYDGKNDVFLNTIGDIGNCYLLKIEDFERKNLITYEECKIAKALYYLNVVLPIPVIEI